METITAVLDADFIQKIASIQKASPNVLYDKLMADLNCNPVVHPFVFEYELFACSLAQQKVREALLRVVEYNEFIKTDMQRQIYIHTFVDAYRLVTFEKYGQERVPPTDIFERCASNDYGEIHSVLMAASLGIPIFYSNDHSSQGLCQRFAHGGVETYNMSEVCEQLMATEGTQTTNKECKFLMNNGGVPRR